MKYILLIVLFVYFGLALFLAEPHILSIFWFSAPVVIPITIEILYLLDRVQSRAIAITGIAVLTLAIPVYISEFLYSGTDAQAGLAMALMPMYQLIILLLASIFVGVGRVFSSE